MYRVFSAGLVLLALIAMPAQATVSLTSYRIYLDNQNNSSSFLVVNKERKTQICEVALKHYAFNQQGELLSEVKDKTPVHSAKPWVRFSPRRFEMPANSSQTIRFVLRRKHNATKGEYRSFVRLDCHSTNPELQQNTLTPKLVHNVPVIVRTGKLTGELSFDKVKVEGKEVTVTLRRSGQRSVFGTLAVVDDSDNIVTFIRGISIYPESTTRTLSLSTNGLPLDKLKVKFKEDSAYGGNILLEQALTK